MTFEIPVSPIQRIAEHPGVPRGISLYIKRDDLLHPEICGSKWRKLAAVLPLIARDYPGGIVTFGGAFSNHLQAVAAAGEIFGIKTFGIVRGQSADPGNPTLRDCQARGMQILALPKSEYDAVKNNLSLLAKLRLSNCFLLPEGGASAEAVAACARIPQEISTQITLAGEQSVHLCVPAGTGCTAAGIAAGIRAAPFMRALVFPVSAQGVSEGSIQQMANMGTAPQSGQIDVVTDYIFGGFAKFHAPVIAFANKFFSDNGILLDPIYTAKMMHGVFDLLGKNYFPAGSIVVALHTGGQQGWAGFCQRYGITMPGASFSAT